MLQQDIILLIFGLVNEDLKLQLEFLSDLGKIFAKWEN